VTLDAPRVSVLAVRRHVGERALSHHALDLFDRAIADARPDDVVALIVGELLDAPVGLLARLLEQLDEVIGERLALLLAGFLGAGRGQQAGAQRREHEDSA
jgi:hypothetical protein